MKGFIAYGMLILAGVGLIFMLIDPETRGFGIGAIVIIGLGILFLWVGGQGERDAAEQKARDEQAAIEKREKYLDEIRGANWRKDEQEARAAQMRAKTGGEP